jgi:hypothetical protein
VTSTAVGLVETGLKNCKELRVNSGVSGLWLPLLHQNYPPEPLDLGCLRLGQVLQLSTLGNSDNSVHPVHSSRGLTVLCTILYSGVRVMGSGLLLSQTRILTLSVPSSIPRMLMKRTSGRRTDSFTLHRMTTAAMDDGSSAGQWHKMAWWQRRSSSARRCSGSTGRRGNGKEVRLRLRGAVVLENVGWPSTEVERRGRRGGGKR